MIDHRGLYWDDVDWLPEYHVRQKLGPARFARLTKKPIGAQPAWLSGFLMADGGLYFRKDLVELRENEDRSIHGDDDAGRAIRRRPAPSRSPTVTKSLGRPNVGVPIFGTPTKPGPRSVSGLIMAIMKQGARVCELPNGQYALIWSKSGELMERMTFRKPEAAVNYARRQGWELKGSTQADMEGPLTVACPLCKATGDCPDCQGKGVIE
ncbi:MAG TPA: hypothetical protein VGX70_08160, partial [Gemmataceae bacterium]|nr:hypothetical protein [Gemmataceae bacterium]